jgi:hemolysin activation/secretion protein
VNVLLTAAGQYAFDPLLSSAQFTFGGSDLGRGYDSAELIGDHGVAGGVELQWGLATGRSYLEGLQLFAAYDYGVVWQRDRSLPDRRSSGSTAALGTRLNLTSWLSGELEVALPLTRPATIDRSDGERKPRFFFAFTARY